MLRVLAIAVLLAACVPGVARGSGWLRPARGRIARAFSVTPGSPYAAGQRRGIVIAAAPGARVRSACTGRVAFAGPIARAGPTLSVQCGALRATYQGLASIAVRRGDTVIRGMIVATVGAGEGLRLGARTAARSYVDPAGLMGDDPAPPPPLGPAPRGAARREPPGPPVPPGPALAPVAVPTAVAAPRPARAPALAWIALALLACSLPGGAVLERRRRRARTAHHARTEPGLAEP